MDSGLADEAMGSKERPVVLITTVDIGGGRSDKIELRRGDDPTDAARAFCQRHSLPPSVVGPLTMHILDNLRKAQTKAASRSNEVSRAGSDRLAEDMMAGEDAAAQQALRTGGSISSGALKPAFMAQQRPSQGEEQRERLSFANGMNDRLYEQLSAKLLHVDDKDRMLTVSAAHSGQPLSSRQAASSQITNSSEHRKSHSAGPSPRDSVHHRLYNNALVVKSKQELKRRALKEEEVASMSKTRSSMSWISQEMMRDRTHGPFENYGEMLYAEGLEAAAVRRSKAAVVRAERAARELEGVTFTPEITRLAATLWSGGDLESQPAWQRLSQDKRAKTLERISEMKRHREDTELKECTFRPRVNKTSAQMMSDRAEALKALNVTAHDQLFQDAIRRQQKMAELQHWLPEDATFAPQINKTSTAMMHLRHSLESGVAGSEAGSPGKEGSVADSVRSSATSSVVDRLYAFHDKVKAKLEEKREMLNGSIDPATGRQLYKPEVGRAPRSLVRNREGAPIGEYLYTVALDIASRKEAQLEAEREADREAANLRHSTNMSGKLYAQLRSKRFAQIFEYLDEGASGVLDVVGLVRAPSAHMDNLDNEVREDVELAAEIHAQASGVDLLPPSPDPAAPVGGYTPDQLAALPPAPPVDLAQFAGLMDKALMKRRKPRAYLVPSPSAKYQPNHTFKPAINKRSKEMASRLRPAEVPVHDVLHLNAEAVRSKQEAMRKELEEAALASCTFAPKLNAPTLHGRPVEGRALRAAGATAVSASRQWSLSSSAAGSPRPPASKGSPGPHMSQPAQQQQQPQGGSSGADSAQREGSAGAELAAFLALEREVTEALAGVSLAHEALDEISSSEVTQDTPGHQQQQGGTPTSSNKVAAAQQQVSAVLRDQLKGVDPADLRQTEELLLSLLTTSDGSDPAADAVMLDQLHSYLVQAQQQAGPPAQQQEGKPVPTADATIVAVPSVASRRSTKEGAAGAPGSVSMYVVASAAAPAAPLQDLLTQLQ